MTGLMRTGLLVGALAVLAAGSAEARKHVWTVGTEDVVVFDPEASASVLRFSLPARLQALRIDRAMVEFFVDAESDPDGAPYHIRLAPAANVSLESGTYDVINESAVAFTGTGEGQDERVRMDVTDAVRHWVMNGGTGYMVIEGGSTTERTASLATSDLEGGAVVRLTVWTSKR